MRPGGLTAVCVIAFVLAAFGFCTLSCGFVGLALQPAIADMTKSMQNSMPTPPGPGGQQFQAQMDAQSQMYEELASMQQRHLPLMITQYVLHFVVVVLLIVGGVRALQGKQNGQRMVVISMIALMVFALLRLYPQYAIQAETQEVSRRYRNQIMQATPGGGATAAMSSSMMGMSTAFQMAIMGIWMLALLGYAGTSIWYVNQPQVDQWFASSAALEIENFTDDPESSAEASPPEDEGIA